MAGKTSRWSFPSFEISLGVELLSIAQSILRNYFEFDIPDVAYLGGAGGFSGAQIWKVSAPSQEFCLRRWPWKHPDRERLEWINLVLAHARNQECPFIAVPLESKQGERFVVANGFFWELAPWMPGQACFDQDPNDQRLFHVMRCLAKFHLASAQVNLGFQSSANLIARHSALQDSARLVSAIGNASTSEYGVDVSRLQQRIVQLGGTHGIGHAQELERFVHTVFPVQPVIRDVWHDHILFTENQVTGLVDYGAMQIDNVALDLARVLGSLVGEEPERWQLALDAYSTIRPCSEVETELVFALDHSAAFLGSLNWLKWLLLEQRSFESREQVEKRIRTLLARL